MSRALAIGLALLLGGAGAHAQEAAAVGTPPELLNRIELAGLARQRTPLQVRDAGLGVTVRLDLFVTTEGTVDTVRVSSSSGLFSIDGIARDIARRARFRPATRDGAPAGSWIELPLVFPNAEGAASRTDPPLLLDRESYIASIQSVFPEALRRDGLQTHVGVALEIDPAGDVRRAVTAETSCFAEIDGVALGVASGLRFEPAPADARGDRRTQVTIAFGRDSLSVRAAGDADRPPSAQPPRVRPEGPARPAALRNTDEVRRALIRHYPARERDAGIGGTTKMWIYVDESGAVERMQISESSGSCALDGAALSVVRIMKFRAATVGGQPQAVWVEIPVVFSAAGTRR